MGLNCRHVGHCPMPSHGLPGRGHRLNSASFSLSPEMLAAPLRLARVSGLVPAPECRSRGRRIRAEVCGEHRQQCLRAAGHDGSRVDEAALPGKQRRPRHQLCDPFSTQRAAGGQSRCSAGYSLVQAARLTQDLGQQLEAWALALRQPDPQRHARRSRSAEGGSRSRQVSSQIRRRSILPGDAWRPRRCSRLPIFPTLLRLGLAVLFRGG
mmetsp:Transcript_63767/g.114750  ORF Transcript_63767/g.114750 Transcript_63767/m.114750 type:complete len:210 (-) Transcript_63767:1039-1668(-)